MTTARILIAVKPEPLPIVEAALTGYELHVARDVGHGSHLIKQQRFDLFVIGILFDDSRALELIKATRVDSKNNKSPILVVRLMQSQHEDMLRQVVDTMLTLDVVADYFEADYQEPFIGAALRQKVQSLLVHSNAFSKETAD